MLFIIYFIQLVLHFLGYQGEESRWANGMTPVAFWKVDRFSTRSTLSSHTKKVAHSEKRCWLERFFPQAVAYNHMLSLLNGNNWNKCYSEKKKKGYMDRHSKLSTFSICITTCGRDQGGWMNTCAKHYKFWWETLVSDSERFDEVSFITLHVIKSLQWQNMEPLNYQRTEDIAISAGFYWMPPTAFFQSCNVSKLQYTRELESPKLIIFQ